MNRVGCLGWAALVVSAIAPVAHAQPASAESTPDPAAGPAFVGLQRFDATSRAGVELTQNDPFYAQVRRRWEVFGQWVEPTHRIGGYLRLPYMTEIYQDVDAPLRRSSAFGNLALGAIWLPRWSSRQMALVVHAGVELPSGAEEMTYFFKSTITRPHELLSTFTHWATVSGGGSLLFTDKHLFARVDGGIELPFVSTDSRYPADLVGIHVNAGIGFRAGPVSIAGELSTMTMLTGEHYIFGWDGSDGADFFGSLGISLRYRTRWVEPFASFVVPMGERQRNRMPRAVVLGIEAVLP